jgi:hypothetical protein
MDSVLLKAKKQEVIIPYNQCNGNHRQIYPPENMQAGPAENL